MKIFKILAIFGLFVSANLLAQTSESSSFEQGKVSFDKVDNQINILKGLKEKYSLKESNPNALHQDLRLLTNYAQSLSQYLLNNFENNTLQPYSLNLIHEFLGAFMALNINILQMENSTETLVLQAIQLSNFKKVNDLFFHPKALRTLLNDQINTESLKINGWTSLSAQILNKRNAEKLEAKLKSKAFPVNKLPGRISQELKLSFAGSEAYALLQKGKSLSELADNELFWRRAGDGILGALGKIPTGASSAFGAVAGNIAWREGYLKENQNLLSLLEENLVPFDLLMEKKAYKFTDITIPGHWGHVGIYLGSEKQLKELGLWDLPEIAPFRENIKKGKRIFQVRRWGLVFDSLEEFSNLDEMAVLRLKSFNKRNKSEVKQTLSYLSDQIGKDYDFSFDAMTNEKITCTEIIAFSFGTIKWPTEALLGRLTISPNNLAELAFFTDSPLQTIYYITGDEKGMHFKTPEDLGNTLGYVKKSSTYYKHQLACERELYRHRRDSIRFKYRCDDLFTERDYNQL